MSAPRLSRRALFGAGLSRALQARVDRLDAAAPALEERKPPPPEAPFPGWGENDEGPLGDRLAPVASGLLERCGVGPGMRVLVAGAGDGPLARAAAGAGAQVTAVEAFEERAERGRALCAQAGLEVDWQIGSPEKLPVADEGFDAVLSLFATSYAADPRAAAAELARVVVRDAPIAFTAWMGAMGELLRGVGGAARRSERWARYETAYLHFFDFPELDVIEDLVPWRFEGIEQAVDELTAPAPGDHVGEVARDVLGRHTAALAGGEVELRAAYATVFARRL